MNKRKWTKAALALSACLLLLWCVLGTGTTLAWFSDSDSVRNEFQIGLLNMEVDYLNDIVTDYTPLEGAEKAFNDEALYEPGYTQVVYLRIKNTGDTAFDYKVAVTVKDVDIGYNAWGDDIYLPNYLRYGVVFAESEAKLKELVKDRLASRNQAPNEWGALDTWSKMSPYTYDVGEDPHYAALIVYMPEDVGNVANYRGFQVPQVKLGITVFAQQKNTMKE